MFVACRNGHDRVLNVLMLAKVSCSQQPAVCGLTLHRAAALNGHLTIANFLTHIAQRDESNPKHFEYDLSHEKEVVENVRRQREKLRSVILFGAASHSQSTQHQMKLPVMDSRQSAQRQRVHPRDFEVTSDLSAEDKAMLRRADSLDRLLYVQQRVVPRPVPHTFGRGKKVNKASLTPAEQKELKKLQKHKQRLLAKKN
mgnify:CR=1 FL=1